MSILEQGRRIRFEGHHSFDAIQSATVLRRQKSNLWNGTKEGVTLAITNTQASRNLGMVLLAIWLILTGLLPLLNVRVSSTVNMALAILAIAAGLLILLRR